MAVSPAPLSLPAGRKVDVRLPYIGTLPATVEAASGDRLLVTLAVADSRVQRLGGTEVAVESTTERGIQRFTGTLVLHQRPELLEIAVAGEAERIQRREWARVGATVPIRVKAVGDSIETEGETSTLNISGGGVLIKDVWRLPLGLDVRIEIVIDPDQPPVHALARVIRDVGTEQKGLRFEDLAREDSERLMKFVRERERAALRISRGL
jgi:c-di-GMP-binding flagellar brake protein YcgR